MSKVRALNSDGITPHVVLESLADHIDDCIDLYVVAMNKEGDPVVWSTGDLKGVAFASVCLHELAIKIIRGEVESE